MFCLFLPDQPAPSRHQMVRRHTKPHLILSAAWGDALPGAPLPRVAPSTTVPIFKAQSEPNNTLNALCKSAYLIDFLHKKHLLQVIYEKKKRRSTFAEETGRLYKRKILTVWNGGHTISLTRASADLTSDNSTSSNFINSNSVNDNASWN